MAIDGINQSNVHPLQPVGAVRRIQDGQPRAEEGKTSAQSGKESPPGRNIDAVVAESAARAVVDLNDYVQKVGREIRFSVDDESGHMVIKVMDSKTDEVIRQIPSDEVLALAEFLRDSMSLHSTGLFEKA